MIKFWLIVFGSLLLAADSTCQIQIDLSHNVYTFTGKKTGKPIANLELLDDSTVNAIANAAIHGTTRARLAQLNLPDFDSKLQQMLIDNLLIERDGVFVLTFPVISGETREQLNAVVGKEAAALEPAVAALLDRLKTALPGHEEMVFHLLWSRVMDRMWCETWQIEKRKDRCPPFVRWSIYPENSFAFGTSSWDGVLGNGSNSVTWGHRSICGAFRVGSHQKELLEGGWGHQVDPATVSDLQPLGLFDPQGKFTGYAYRDEDSVGLLLKQLTTEYARLVSNAYDYDGLSRQWEVPVDGLWIILQHETAYVILHRLSESGKLIIPKPLLGLGDQNECRDVISLRLVNPPAGQIEAR